MNTANQQETGILRRGVGAARCSAALDPAHPASLTKRCLERFKIFGCLAAVAIFLAGAAPLPAQPESSAAASEAQTAGAPASRPVPMMAASQASGAPKAPDFSVQANDGQTYTLDGLKGNVVLLFFWASWCPYCRRAVPHMVSLSNEYANSSFTMIGISGDKDADAWRNYVEDHQMQWPQYLDRGHRIANLFGARGVPNFFLIDKNGDVVFHVRGWGDSLAGLLERRIDQALNEPDQQAGKRPAVHAGARVLQLTLTHQPEAAARSEDFRLSESLRPCKIVN